ncbi:hypothetical protein [Shimia abyssi]|uniref:DUF4189 domain-containing protein n=1 Tax=Shimia abyssi TaxID=1662395 RepID=A0A2P8FER0_9RHOB|nr:hypothetical protein [Shimia abyssi]PSL20207.1 hypothetical protein CLV88_104268 [Shimia abyssi]
MKHSIAAAILGIAASLVALPVLAQDINIEKKRSRVHEMSDLKLKGSARKDFRRFKRKAKYYGAFYVNYAEKKAGAYWGAPNIEAAERHARISCQINSGKPYGCYLHARILPKHHDPSEAGLTLSREGSLEFREYSNLQADDRFGAFAISESGAIGYSWAEASRDWAAREAVKRCDKAARKMLKSADKDLRAALKATGGQTCRVVHYAR